jgi:hypothetical protein
MTHLLRRPGGTYEIRPIQAEALAQLARLGGLFAPIPPGCGKTLITVLAPAVLHMRGDGSGDRVLLLVPASVVAKTYDDAQMLAQHFAIRPFRVMSYSMLSMAKYATVLEDFKPTCIVMDEAHHLKKSSGARWRRLRRYDQLCDRRGDPRPLYAALSGSFSTRGVSDFRHILARCLGVGAPVTRDPREAYMWGLALDSKVRPDTRVEPGALATVAPPGPEETIFDEPITRVRDRLGRRMRASIGVVSYAEGFPAAELCVSAVHVEPTPKVLDALETMRASYELPCGYPIPDTLSLWRHERELSTGMVQRWRVQAPAPWMHARREWCAYVRERITHSRTIDTELQVRRDVVLHQPPDGVSALRAWDEIEPTFTPDPEAVWISDHRLIHAAEWLAAHPRGIVWTTHIPFGARLSEMTGVRYFPRDGRIDTHRGPAIASVSSCGTGLNLQHYHRANYIVSPPTTGGANEQLLARTHRDGQEHTHVSAVYALSLPADVRALDQALADARMSSPVLQAPQRLLLGPIVGLDETREKVGA